MELKGKICREYYSKQTKGVLELTDLETDKVVFSCKTLELPDLKNATNVSCVLEGIFKVVPRYSKKYGHHLHITDVDGRGYILIHWGNFAGSDNPISGHPDIRGCVLVGSAYKDINGDEIDEIVNSKNTFKKLMKIAPEGFMLEITQ